jgi:hypothetical protein
MLFGGQGTSVIRQCDTASLPEPQRSADDTRGVFGNVYYRSDSVS